MPLKQSRELSARVLHAREETRGQPPTGQRPERIEERTVSTRGRVPTQREQCHERREDTMPRFAAAVLGASGQVGGCVVRSLLAEPRCTSILLFNRRKLDAFDNEPRVKQHIVDLDKLATEAV